jgi:hypothetical protein
LVSCGDVFYITTPHSNKTPHYWIVVTDPDPQTNEVAAVNITDIENCFDMTVIVEKGEDHFVTKRSAAYFIDARMLHVAALESASTVDRTPDFVCIQKPPCKRALLARLQAGMLASKHTKPKIKAHCRKMWNRP